MWRYYRQVSSDVQHQSKTNQQRRGTPEVSLERRYAAAPVVG